MTCIVAGPGWMASDRRVTSDDGSTSSLVKIAKNKWLIAAASGNAVSTLAVKRAVAKGAWSGEDLLEHVDAYSYALVLFPTGILWRLQDGAVWPCKAGELQGIGSGADLALGYLQASHNESRPGPWRIAHDRDVIRRAFAFVARRRSDCGGGVDFRSFDL